LKPPILPRKTIGFETQNRRFLVFMVLTSAIIVAKIRLLRRIDKKGNHRCQGFHRLHITTRTGFYQLYFLFSVKIITFVARYKNKKA
jgi:hypothetical protein